MKNSKIALILFWLTALALSASAQMARKPSPSREPEGVMSKKPDSKERSLPKIDSREAFDTVARVYHQGTPYALPHVMFIIDRRSKNKIYYVNSQKYRFHKDFLLANYLIPRGSNFFEDIYIKQDRRFMVGTIAWQAPVEKFTFELWEGDLASDKLIKMAYDTINATFFAEVAYKPNSIRQDEASENLEIERVTADEISKNQEYLALNTGEAVGRIHIIDKLDDTVEIGSNEILVLKELPLNLPPVRGIIVAKPSTPLSHVNILAKGWGVPNVYIKNADKLYKDLDGKVIKFTATLVNATYEPASLEDIKNKFTEEQVSAPADLETTRIATLRQMRKKDSVIYGAKAANLGEMMNSVKIPNTIVPDGFGIPYYYYDKFMTDNGFDETVNNFEFDYNFVHNPSVRRKKLEEFRARIQNGKMDEKLRAEIIRRWKTQLGGKAVFVRSSSNVEDLPNFSGAGLYKTVKNVKEEEKIIEGVKTVWASLWNFDAYESRVRNFVKQVSCQMGVFIQVGVNMDAGGVMITKDPFDPENKGVLYVSAVWGHNDPITKNEWVPEQLLYNPKSNAIQILTLSQQETVLKFGSDGDLVETKEKPKRRVLTDVNVRSLVRVANRVKQVFGGKKAQDIEWGMINGRIYLLQARPYID
ncbi:MAG: PEP/pyruvate-binding domain-containing protein [Pyrinomonadaceae bacterium]